ncbi:MAG: molybdopterin adenylyltransferase [Verrucomicrobiota bacterium]
MKLKVGRLTLSDRASQGIYKDESGPEIESVLCKSLDQELDFVVKLLPDEQSLIEKALIELTDFDLCSLVVTTGGTGPSKRDVTPEATRAVLDKELTGFGEIMRMESYKIIKTAILSRATAGVRGNSLIVNLPGNPAAIGQCLPLLTPAILEALRHLNH